MIRQTLSYAMAHWSKAAKNLSSTLRACRHTIKPRIVWVDAICINQSDQAEKETQIVLMRQIYETAKSVFIYIGPNSLTDSTFDGYTAFDLIRRFLACKKLQAERQESKSFSEIAQSGSEVFSEYNLWKLNDPSYEHLGKLLESPWFSRVWIIQELAVAQKATIMWWNVKIAWDKFVEAIDYGWELRIPTFLDYNTRLQRFGALSQARKRTQGGKLMKLQTMLYIYRIFQATDERRRIFAVLGLASDAELLGIKPEYDLSVDQLYRDTADRMLRVDRSLALLSIPKGMSGPSLPDWPSWVPDWRSTPGCTPLVMYDIDPNGPSYFSCQATPIAEKDAPLMEYHRSSGGMVGYVFDEVAEVGRTSRPTSEIPLHEAMSLMPRDWAVLTEWLRIASHIPGKKYVRTSESHFEVFRQILVAGKATDEPTFKQDFQNWWSLARYGRIVPTSSTLKFLEPVSIRAAFYLSLGNNQFLKDGIKSLMRIRDKMLATVHRRFFRTVEGHLGLGPHTMLTGDQIVLCKGARVPFVLRSRSSEWELVGDCWVHGIMQGEAFQEDKCNLLWIV